MLLDKSLYPHLSNKVVDYKLENNNMKTIINIDSEYHTYLKDHIFGTNFFVPATFIIELIIEMSILYCEYVLKMEGNKIRPYKLIDLNIMRALKRLPGENMNAAFNVELTNKSDGTVEMDVLIFSDRINKQGEVIGIQQNVSCKVLITETEEKAVRFDVPEVDFQYYNLSKEKMYHDMFPNLGYHFQVCSWMIGMDLNKEHFLGSYHCENKESTCIKGSDETIFVTSPLGNDACLQCAVLFSRLINLVGRLPVGAQSIEFIRKPEIDSIVNVYIRIISIDEDMVCDIYSYDSQGVCVILNHFCFSKSPYHSILDRISADNLLNSNH